MNNIASVSHSENAKVRVALIHVCSPQGSKVWPYINFDYETRKAEIEQALAEGCTGIEFVPLTVQGSPEEEVDRVDGSIAACDRDVEETRRIRR